MKENKKKEQEREMLNHFLATPIGKEWYEKQNIKEIIENESPDFILVTQDDKRIGLEITQFIFKSKHWMAMRSLKSTGNKLCQYSIKKHNLQISILIDKYDKRIHQARTKQDLLEAAYNPGFIDRFNEQEIKSQIEPFIDENLEKLKKFPSLIKAWIQIDNEYLCFTISGLPDRNGKYNCTVNNESFSLENPFELLQQTIDNKNEKYDNLMQKCDKCFLLIYKPDVSEGNYCYFTDELKSHKFISKYENVFLYKEYKKISLILESKG